MRHGPSDPDPGQEPEPPPLHSRGFPGFGPPSLCGGEGPVASEPVSEITCPACVELLGDGPKLALRLAEINIDRGLGEDLSKALYERTAREVRELCEREGVEEPHRSRLLAAAEAHDFELLDALLDDYEASP
jgi:hypothetical protein